MSGTLIVRLIKATNLSPISITGNIDPYVIVTTGHQYNWKNKSQKSRILKKTRNPMWDQSFTFNVQDIRQDVVQLTIWDYNPLDSNKMIGQTTTPVNNLPHGVESIQQLPIHRGKKTKGYMEVGLTAIDFGISQVTTTTTMYLPQTTTYTPPVIQQQPLIPQPIPTQTYVQEVIPQPIPTQTFYQEVIPPQPVYPTAPQVMIEYENGGPMIDNNAYMLYSGMLYGNPMQTDQQMVPLMPVEQNYPEI